MILFTLLKKLITNFRNIKNKLTMLGGIITSTLILAQSRVYAASNTESIDSFINFACDWLTKIGGVIALVGGVMFALGWQREDSERKISWINDIDGWFHVSCNCPI